MLIRRFLPNLVTYARRAAPSSLFLAEDNDLCCRLVLTLLFERGLLRQNDPVLLLLVVDCDEGTFLVKR
jgi:hypothetical protein